MRQCCNTTPSLDLFGTNTLPRVTKWFRIHSGVDSLAPPKVCLKETPVTLIVKSLVKKLMVFSGS